MHGKQLTGQYTHVIQIPQFNSPTTQKTANNMENTKRSKTTLGHHYVKHEQLTQYPILNHLGIFTIHVCK